MKKINPRKNIRLKGYDYSKSGYYFITICVKERLELLGKIVGVDTYGRPENSKNNVGVAPLGDPKIILTDEGLIVKKYIENCNKINNIRIDEFVIMPNHIHLLIEIKTGSPKGATPTIPKIINSLKSIITKEIGASIWQRNYYEHVIRDEKEYIEIIQYIINNPYNWEKDKYY